MRLWAKKLLFKKAKESLPAPTEYIFETCEAHCVGDYYKYVVKADSKEEAFRKLVEFFYGEGYPNADIKSSDATVSYPYRSIEYWTGMPDWFYRILKGEARGPRGEPAPERAEKDRELLKQYCRIHNIKLKNSD